MARIALINPSQDLDVIYGQLSEEASALPPLGLCYLAGIIRQSGHQVKIIDTPALKISNKEAAHLAMEWNAGYIGITATTDTIFLAAEIADIIKSESSHFEIIIGGSHVTAVPENTLLSNPSFDYGVIGEGEETLKELIATLESGRNPDEIQGIAYRSGDKVKITVPRNFISDLDSLPLPAWDLLPELSRFYKPAVLNYKQLPSTSLVTSRGCPGRCAFCDTKVFGSRYRVQSAERVLETIRHLKDNYGIRDICFYDDVFTVFKKRLVQICEGLRDKKTKVDWSCQARVNIVNYEMMKMMKESGCWKISFGIESASNDILKLMRKNTTVEQAKKAVSEAKRAGLEVEGYFILGFFGENKNTLKITKDFIVKSDLDAVLLSYFLPFPGSPAYPQVSEYGKFNEDWRNMNAIDSDKPQFIPNGLTGNDLAGAQKEIYKSFYFRPKAFSKYALRMVKNPAYATKLMRASLNFTKFLWKNSKSF